MKALREALGDSIVELGQEFQNLNLIDVDVGKSCKTLKFKQTFPERYVNVGIAEQNAVGIAAGLSTCGKIPVIAAYAVFASMRCVEQIRQSVCYPKLNVKVFASHGGITSGNDGATHQSVEDLGILRTLPGMTVIAPADYYSAKKLLKAAIVKQGPVYIRLTRDAVPFVYSEDDEFEIGKSRTLREGNDVTIIAAGDIMQQAIDAADALKKEGISARLIDMYTVKPVDEEAIITAMRETKGIVTVEDHNVLCGLGSAVSEVAGENGGCPVHKIGINDHFGESGPYQELLAKYGITVEHIVEEAKKIVRKTD